MAGVACKQQRPFGGRDRPRFWEHVTSSGSILETRHPVRGTGANQQPRELYVWAVWNRGGWDGPAWWLGWRHTDTGSKSYSSRFFFLKPNFIFGFFFFFWHKEAK